MHELLARADSIAAAFKTSLVRFFIFAVAATAVEHHAVEFKSEQVLPDLQVLPVTRESQRQLWEVGLTIGKQIENVSIEKLLK